MRAGSALIAGTGGQAVALAIALAGAGIATTIVEPDPWAAERLNHALRDISGDLSIVPGLDALAAADVVIDAGGPGLDAALAALGRPPGLVVTCDPDAAWRGARIGFCPLAPFHLRALVEVTPPTGPVAAAALDAAVALAARIGKQVVMAPPGRASVAMRLMRCLLDTAESLLAQGAIAHEIGEAMVAAGFDLGLFESQDLIGLDVDHAARRCAEPPRRLAHPGIAIMDRMVNEGRLGCKVGVGWYRYPGGGGAVIDPLVEDLVREEAWFARIPQRVFSAADIVTALRGAMRDEAAAMRADGSAPEGAVIDLVARLGFGAPPGFVEP